MKVYQYLCVAMFVSQVFYITRILGILGPSIIISILATILFLLDLIVSIKFSKAVMLFILAESKQKQHIIVTTVIWMFQFFLFAFFIVRAMSEDLMRGGNWYMI